MQEVLLNQANLALINFCKDNGIDCSGSHVTKNGRGFTYSLIKDDTGRAFANVTFSKYSSPHFGIINF